MADTCLADLHMLQKIAKARGYNVTHIGTLSSDGSVFDSAGKVLSKIAWWQCFSNHTDTVSCPLNITRTLDGMTTCRLGQPPKGDLHLVWVPRLMRRFENWVARLGFPREPTASFYNPRQGVFCLAVRQ